VARGAITILKSSIPYVTRVVNRHAATGGVDGETLDEAKSRGPIQMRTRNRAVTAGDYEQLAKEAAPEVARVRCVPASQSVAQALDDGAGVGTGVRVLVVPTIDRDEMGRLRFEQLMLPDDILQRIVSHLDQRRVVGARIVVEPPNYQAITIVARIRARRRIRIADVELDALQALYRYYDPVVGGPDGMGWPFGRPVHVGEVFAVLQGVDGVDYIEEARLFAADPVTGERGAPVDRIELSSNSLVFSYEHLLRVERT
jgi:predicted phage baseplate assembly protein